MEKESKITRTSLRLTPSLYEKLDKAASDKGLTMHAEIISRLEASFSSHDLDKSTDERIQVLLDVIEDIRSGII